MVFTSMEDSTNVEVADTEFQNLKEDLWQSFFHQICQEQNIPYFENMFTENMIFSSCWTPDAFAFTICSRDQFKSKHTIVKILYFHRTQSFAETHGIHHVDSLIRDMILSANMIL